MKPYRVLVTDVLAQVGIDVLSQAAEVDMRPGISSEELKSIIGDYDALIVRSTTKVTREIIEAAKKLRVIGRAGVGVDNIDVVAATERGIYVVNSPDAVTIAAAEHTMALLLALARRVVQAHSAMNTANKSGGSVDRKKFMGTQLAGKTMGIIGIGRIGSYVAKLSQAFGMRVIGYDPFVTIESARQKGIEWKELEVLLKEADVISLHVPLTDETYHMLDTRQFEMMKDGVMIINTSRGAVINEAALYKALVGGKVAGAAVDVVEAEPPWKTKLLELENVIVTPHLGASTVEAQEVAARDIAEQLLTVLKGEIPRNAVNLPPIPIEVREFLKPFMQLAERIGRFQSQICRGGIKLIQLFHAGQLASYDTAPLTSAFLKGFLEVRLSEAVNYLNAPVIARSRGIGFTDERTTEDVGYSNLITARVITTQEQWTVSGSLIRDVGMRIVRINQYHVDVIPEGHALVFEQYDKPGIVGRVGTLLGSHNINIANMQLGRERVGGHSIMIMLVDNPVPNELLEQMKTFPNIIDVRSVYFGPPLSETMQSP
ncbi:MAG: phosphoglycerate dehydrogenase [Armatimonadota bacterium]|nr:phosphoglycerate dehydrogenase [Armatimonadota bacterium]MCX7778002.1 phosphoglycerate dehydrogenase [Armatimonadota bacterium]MDW8026023.1 phosphoglycerate dehydrogenase [Armatimonadota bacterium]